MSPAMPDAWRILADTSVSLTTLDLNFFVHIFYWSVIIMCPFKMNNSLVLELCRHHHSRF